MNVNVFTMYKVRVSKPWTSRMGSRKALHSTGKCGEDDCDYYFVLTLATSQYIFTLCALFHVFSDTGGWFLCDRQADDCLQSFLYRGRNLQGWEHYVWWKSLQQTYLCAERFVDLLCCQMVTQKISHFSRIQHNFLRSVPPSTFPKYILSSVLRQAHTYAHLHCVIHFTKRPTHAPISTLLYSH
jgi:hypothetical protein